MQVFHCLEQALAFKVTEHSLPPVSAVEVIVSVPCFCVSVFPCVRLSVTVWAIAIEVHVPVSQGLSIGAKELCVQNDSGLRMREGRQRWGVFIIYD